jgi:hypothetical protein
MPDQVDTIPPGDLKFYDNDTPGLTGGNYWISVTHSLTEKGAALNPPTDPLGAAQEFVVSAPQFTLPADDIISLHPPDSATGRFGEQLPHVVFREPALPWERMMAEKTIPWLALLVFTEDELVGPPTSPVRGNSTSVQNFLMPEPSEPTVYRAGIVREDDVGAGSACTYIKMTTATFTAVTPRLDEARFLAHCRQANISDKATQNLDPDGFFSVVVANRFPATPAAQATAPKKNIVHLVSLEGLGAVLVDNPAFGSCTHVALISLASWTFQCLPDHAEDFRGLLKAIVGSEMSGTDYVPDNLWLRLPVPALANGAGEDRVQVVQRLSNGFVPLAYHTRSGETTFAWYRGPLAPALTAPVVKKCPFLTADAAIAYQKSWGVFDMSLATAWNAGRSAALSDKAFGQSLFDFRRRAHDITDQLLHRLQSKYFSQDQIDGLSHDTTVQDEFLSVLHADLLKAIGAAPPKDPTPVQAAATTAADPKAAVAEFLADPALQKKIVALVKDDLDRVAQWLAKLLLLYPLPFNLLVPDARMLPVESLRFFYVDNNWTGALLDGALSIGLESSRQTFFHTATHGLLQSAARDAAAVYRQSVIGSKPPPAEENLGEISGFLLRSGLVSGWPNLAVRPYLKSGGMLKILRMDHLSPNVLLCMFWGVPDYVEISEPQEGFRFGVDEDGDATLRNVIAPAKDGDAPIGKQIGNPFPVYDPKGVKPLLVRTPQSRVLNLAPAAPAGLIKSITAALSAASSPAKVDTLGPATFALQMVKSPEAIKFTSRSS